MNLLVEINDSQMCDRPSGYPRGIDNVCGVYTLKWKYPNSLTLRFPSAGCSPGESDGLLQAQGQLGVSMVAGPGQGQDWRPVSEGEMRVPEGKGHAGWCTLGESAEEHNLFSYFPWFQNNTQILS